MNLADDPRVRDVLIEHLTAEFSWAPEPLRASLVDLQVRARLGGFAQDHPDAEPRLLGGTPQHPLGYALVDRAPTELRLVDLVVRPSARRQGVATDALADLIATADATGLPVALTVAPGSPAEALYLRHGFLPDGRDDGMHRELRRPAASEASITTEGAR